MGKKNKKQQSDLANYSLKKHRDSYITGKMSKRISNFQIKDPIKNLEEDETMKNFVGMFPANHMNTFISFKPTISEKTVKYPFLRILTAQIKAVHIGDVTIQRMYIPTNVTIKIARAIGPRQEQKQKQQGWWLLSSAFKLGS